MDMNMICKIRIHIMLWPALEATQMASREEGEKKTRFVTIL
jgi:hypothetical protein